MKILISLILSYSIFYNITAHADTPPPGTVKAKTYSGDGLTAIGATGDALNVNVTNSGGLSTVNQGNAGVESWLATITSSALPTNACQETGGHLASIDSKLTSPLAVTGTFWQATQPISVASLPLPTGAATSANQSTMISSLSSIDSKTPALGQALAAGSVPVVLTASQLSTLTPLSTVTVNGTVTANAGTGTFLVDGSAHTQPVSGTFWQATQPVSGTVTANAGSGTFTVDASGFTVPVSGTFWQATQPVSAAALPLPSGAATSAKQPALGVAGTASVDVLTVQGIASMTPLKVDASGFTVTVDGTVTANAGTGTFLVDGSAHTQPVSGTFWQATQPVSGTFWQATQPVSAASLPLPSGASTSANQSTIISSLSSIDSKTPALGQALAVASVPVVLTASQLSTLTPLSTVTANAGTGTFLVDGSAHTQPVSGTFWQATQPVSGTFWQATQPVSIASLPALAAGSAIIGKVGIDQTTPGTTNGVQINAALPAGSNVIGHVIVDTAPTTAVTQSGTWTVQPGNTANTTAWLVNAQPKTPAALTVRQAAITIGTSAVRLTTDGLAAAATRVLLVAQLISTSTANCYFGASSVASSGASRGVQMFAGQPFSFNNDAGDYYAICDTSSQTFLITEQE